MKLTPKKIRALVREEKQASRMYRKYGLRRISKDETRHARHLNRLLKRK